MDFSMNSEEYSRLIDLISKISGTVEPSFRYFQIYYKRGLKFFAQDGCAKLEFASQIEVPPFSGTYTVPIDYARALKTSEQEKSIVFSLEEKAVKIKTGSEMLVLEGSRENDIPVMERKFEFSSSYSLTDFKTCLDFASASSMEGDNIEIFSQDDQTYFVASAGRLTLISVLESQTKSQFRLSIPYVTVRHLVKGFESLKVEEVYTGIGIAELGIKAGALLFSICSDEASYEPPVELINSECSSKISRREVLSALQKISRLSRKGFSILMISRNSALRFYIRAANLRYECDIPYLNGEEFMLQVDPHRLHSALSRIKGSNLCLSTKSGKLLISSSRGHQHLIIPLIK